MFEVAQNLAYIVWGLIALNGLWHIFGFKPIIPWIQGAKDCPFCDGKGWSHCYGEDDYITSREHDIERFRERYEGNE